MQRQISPSPRRWWDAQGDAYPHAAYVGLRSTRRGTPIDICWSLPVDLSGSVSGTKPAAFTVFQLRWEAVTGLALPDDPRTPPSEPAPPLPRMEPYDCPRPLLGYTTVQSPTAGESVPVCVSCSEPGTWAVSLHRLISWERTVGIEAHPVPCGAIDGRQHEARDQPIRCGSYGISETAGGFPAAAGGFTVAATIWPTAPVKTAPQEGVQTYPPGLRQAVVSPVHTLLLCK